MARAPDPHQGQHDHHDREAGRFGDLVAGDGKLAWKHNLAWIEAQLAA